MDWEFQTRKQMYQYLVGGFYGSSPEDKESLIADSRHQIAARISQFLNLAPDSVVVEVGSGAGHMALAMAPKIKHLHCADVSSSFLNIAKEKCKDLENVSFHHMNSFEMDFVRENSVDAIFSHAVFIHLNFYDILLYFRTFAKVLKTGGRVYIDFLSTDNMDFRKSTAIRQHTYFYAQNKKSLPTLLHLQSEKAIIRMAELFGFFVLNSHEGPDNTVALTLEKGPSPKATDKRRRQIFFLFQQLFSRALSFLKNLAPKF